MTDQSGMAHKNLILDIAINVQQVIWGKKISIEKK